MIFIADMESLPLAGEWPLLSEQGLGVRCIDRLVDLADRALLGFGVATNAIREDELTHIEVTHRHQFCLRSIPKKFLGESRRDPARIRAKVGLLIADDTSHRGGHGTLDGFARTRCKTNGGCSRKAKEQDRFLHIFSHPGFSNLKTGAPTRLTKFLTSQISEWDIDSYQGLGIIPNCIRFVQHISMHISGWGS